MATTQLVNITVEELSRYGFKANGRYVNYSQKLSETDRLNIVPGARFEAEMYIADSGKEYLNKVVKMLPVEKKTMVAKKEAVLAALSPTNTPKAATAGSMSKEEWQAKDRSQLIGGLSHDAASLVASFINVKGIDNVDEAVDMFRNVLNGLLKVRDELK